MHVKLMTVKLFYGVLITQKFISKQHVREIFTRKIKLLFAFRENFKKLDNKKLAFNINCKQRRNRTLI